MARAAADAKTTKTGVPAAPGRRRSADPSAPGVAGPVVGKPKASARAPGKAAKVSSVPALEETPRTSASPAVRRPPKSASATAAARKSTRAATSKPGTRSNKAPVLEVITLPQLAASFAEEKGMTRAEGLALMKEIVGRIRGHIVAGTKVRLAGLGNFEIRDRPARMGRNPATGAAIKIAASRKLVFRPAAELKEAV